MQNQTGLTVSSKEIAEKCAVDIRTLQRHLQTTLEGLGYVLSDERNFEIETYGEFKIQRIWTPTGRLSQIRMNTEMAEMLMVRFDIQTAYKMRTLLRRYRQAGGVLLDELCKQHGIPAVADVLVELGIVAKKFEATDDKTYSVALNKIKNSGGEVQALFLHVPEMSVEDGELTRMRKSIYLYGETAYQVMERLSEHGSTINGEITLN